MNKVLIIRIVSCVLMVGILIAGIIVLPKIGKEEKTSTETIVTETSTKESTTTKEETSEVEETTKADSKTATKATTQTNGNNSSKNTGNNSGGSSNSGGTTTTTKANPTPVRDYAIAQEFLDELNAYRVSKGLCELEMVPFMQEYAMTRANEIITDFSHSQNSLERGIANCPKVTDKYGEIYQYSYSGENIVTGYVSATDSVALNALDTFKHSSGHEANQTNAKWTHVGVGCVKLDYGGYIQYYMSVNFYYENDLCF